MRFLHIIIPSKRMMNTYIRMIREHFSVEEHCFLFYEKCEDSERELLGYGNVIELTGSRRDKVKRLYKECRDADVIIWHGLILSFRRMLPIFFRPSILRKSAWVMRGLDLYNWKNQNNTIRAFIENYVNRSVRKRMRFVVYIFPPDKDVYETQFGKKSELYFAPYPMSKKAFEDMDRFNANVSRDNGVFFIQVGNSSFPYNNHLNTIDSISKYSQENIKVFIPLSYGNAGNDYIENYQQQVKDRAYEIFDNRVEVITKLMPPEKYNQFLMNMDIGIFNSVRQNALGNIIRLLYIGNKVYINPHNPMYKYFISEGITVHDASELGHISFEEFIKKDEAADNKAWVRRIHHPDVQYDYWKKLFEGIASKVSGKKYTCVEYRNNYDEVCKEKNDSFITKKVNYINLERYQPLKVGSKLKDITDVYVMGDKWKYTIIRWMNSQDDNYKRWFVNGIIDNEEKTKSINIKQDIVSDVENFKVDNANMIIAYEDICTRKKAIETLSCKNVVFLNYIHASLLDNINRNLVGQGAIIGPNSYVDESSVIGDFCFVRNASILSNSVIGNYTNITGPNCLVEEDVCIGENCDIQGAHIKKGAKIGNNCVIRTGVIVGEYDVVADGTTLV